MGKTRVTAMVMAAAAIAGAAEPPDLADAIDPMIGAITLSGYGGHGLGKTFPGATTPFGMVQLSPDTITGGDNGPGYSYHHETIEGFSFLHMSGIGWYGDLGNFQVMPGEKASHFSHSNEVARAGYYSVYLDDCQVKAELAAAGDVGVLRFTYPASERSVLKIDLARRIGELRRAKWFSHQQITFDSDTEFHGSIQCDHRDGGWGRGAGGVDYTVYFRGVVSKPLTQRTLTGGDTNLVVQATFPTTLGEAVTLALRVSFNPGELRSPLDEGNGGKVDIADFDHWRQAAKRAWATELGQFGVKGGTVRERRIYATALYHAMIDPREVNAELPKGLVQKRTVFSGWDVFRSEMPFLSLVKPWIVRDTVDSMAAVMASGKRDILPVWDLMGCPSNCMVGNPLFPVILTLQDVGWTKQSAYSERQLLDMMVATVAKRGNDARGWSNGSMSDTLEYCFADWCVGKFAERMGDPAVAARFYDRAKWYTNNWDAAVGSMHARLANGQWTEWKGETRHGQGTVESNPLQQGWFVPHDVYGLMELMGGKENFAAKLEEFFEKAPEDFLWGDYYNHPNEPSHHIAFLFPYCGKPWLTQKWTRRILEKAYNDDVRGLCGNDDVGQMSAWYVLAALGFHPVAPGSGIWILTTPLFEEAWIPCGKGLITVKARGASNPKAVYIRAAKLNGKPLDRAWVTTQELQAGATFEYELGETPNERLFTVLPPR